MSWGVFLIWAVWGWTPIGVRLRIELIERDQAQTAMMAFQIQDEMARVAAAFMNLPEDVKLREKFNVCVIRAMEDQ